MCKDKNFYLMLVLRRAIFFDYTLKNGAEIGLRTIKLTIFAS